LVRADLYRSMSIMWHRRSARFDASSGLFRACCCDG
jgi:hypothetical protein